MSTILIVDDEPGLLENISLALEAEGYQVLTAKDGLEALAILEAHPIDLILADIAMPRMNGYQLYERVRQKSQYALIPFIFLSARSMDTDIHYGKELGVDDYLIKPFRANDLIAVVRGKLRRADHLRQSMSHPGPNTTAHQSAIQVGPICVEPAQHRAWLIGEELKLSVKEFVLLDYLAQRPGVVVNPQELVKVTHNLATDHVEAGALLRPIILSLRRKLGSDSPEQSLIENVRSVGYRLNVPTD